MSAVRVRKNKKLVRYLGLMASASIMSIMMAGEAQAACTVSPAQPLGSVTVTGSTVDCTGANTGQTITVTANDVLVTLAGAGSTLNNSTLTLSGDGNEVDLLGGSAANLVFNGSSSSPTGNGTRLFVANATNLTATLDGPGSINTRAGTITATPGNINLFSTTGIGNSFSSANASILVGSGNNGGAFLLTGGAGSQFLSLNGTMTVQANGLAIATGDGDDLITVGATAVFNGGTGNNILFDGGSGSDRVQIAGAGTWNVNTINIERLDVNAGANNTRFLNGTGDYASVLVGSGAASVANLSALGQSNSNVIINSGATLILALGGNANANNNFSGLGTIAQVGQSVTYGGNGSAFAGTFRIGSGTAILSSANAFGIGTIENNAVLSFGGFDLTNNISGTGQVIVTGNGTALLSGTNTFSGGLDVQGGLLEVANVVSLGSGNIISSNGAGALVVRNNTNQVLANNIVGNIGFVKAGTGTLDLTGTNTYAFGTLIQEGAVRVDSFARLGTGVVVANAGGSLILNYNGAGQLLQTTPFMTGDGSFIKEGTGDVVMNQTSTYTGGTIIRAGRIGLNNGDALGTGNIRVDAGAELGVGGIVLNNNISGSGLVRKTASNLVELYGNNSGFTGTIRVEGGVLFATNGDALGSGTLQLDTGTSVQLGATADSIVAANLTGTGNFEKLGAGRVTLTGDGSLFTGGIGVTGGTLQIAGEQNIGNASVFIGSNGTLGLDTAGNTQLGNFLYGDGRLVKIGNGTVFITNANTYTGGTDIQQGAIRVTNTSVLGTGAITVQAGAALDLSIAGAQTLNQAISGAGILRKSAAGDLTLLGNSLLGGVDIVEGRVIVGTAAALGSGPVTTATDTQLVFNNSTAEVSNTLISGAGSLTKNGTGLLVMNNANSFTGGTVINAGRLGLNNGLGLGTGNIIVMQNAILGIGGVNLANNVSGAGSVIKTANNTATMTGNNSYSGGTDIQGGTLVVNNPAALGSGGVNIGSGAFLNIDYIGATNVALNNVLSGAGSLIKDGSGAVIINVSGNSFSGGTTINAGRLGLNFGDGLGTGNVLVNAGAILGIGNITFANNVSGAGQIIKTASGAATLTGTNTHTGGIDIQGGSIVVNSAAPLGTGGVSTATGTQLVFNITGNQGSSVAISGAGSIVKQGTGLFAINNANSYTGGTDITAGRLVANAGGAFGTGTVTIANGAELGLGGVTVGNTITGSGRVIKTASNSGTLTGNNSYSGGTDIQGGTLVVNSPAALGTGAVTIGAGTTLNVNYAGSTNVALDNILSGAGALVKDGTGTVIMNSGSNSFTGGTTINAGRLGLNFGNALGTGAVTIGAGASLALGDVTYANATSGAGQIIKSSAGLTTLTGTNTHSGGIAIQAGTLGVAGNGALGSGSMTVSAGAVLEYTNAATSTFSNGLSGAGTFRKLGAGQLSFANNFGIGALDLVAGRTRMNVVGTTNVTVGPNATLDGTGRIIGNLTNNGIVAPGNSIGTLTVQGNYTHNANSVLEVEFDAAGNIDLLDVTGNATLNGGTLRFVSIGGAEGQGGTFLRTGGTLTGTFATVQTVGALLPLAVVYEPNRAFMAPSVLTARPSTFNAQSMAAADTALGFIDSIGIGDVRHGEGNRIWLNGFGAWGKRSASGTTLAYDHDTRGMSGGVNFDAGDAITVGVALGWAKGDITLGAGGGGGDQSSILGSINARYSGTGFTLGGGLLYGKVDQDTLRNVSFNGFSGSVDGETDSKIFGAFAELGLPLGSTGGWSFNANARGSYVRQKQDGYTESGTSPLRLTLGDLETSTLEGQAKLTAKTSLWDRSNGGEETPEGIDLRIDLGGRYLGTLGNRDIPVTFAVSNAGIVLQGDTRNTLQGLFGVALDYTTRSGATFSFGYKGEVGKTDRHALQAGVSFAF